MAQQNKLILYFWIISLTTTLNAIIIAAQIIWWLSNIIFCIAWLVIITLAYNILTSANKLDVDKFRKTRIERNPFFMILFLPTVAVIAGIGWTITAIAIFFIAPGSFCLAQYQRTIKDLSEIHAEVVDNPNTTTSGN